MIQYTYYNNNKTLIMDKYTYFNKNNKICDNGGGRDAVIILLS